MAQCVKLLPLTPVSQQYWLESQLLHFRSNSLITRQGKTQKMYQVLGSLPTTFETWIRVPVPGFHKVQSQLPQPLGCEPVGGTSLPVTLLPTSHPPKSGTFKTVIIHALKAFYCMVPICLSHL